MRTFFNIVLGILFTVVKAALHALVSTVGAFGLCALAALAGIYGFRRWSAAREGPVEKSKIVPIDR